MARRPAPADPIEVLHQAVNVVRQSGRTCAGWTMQASDDGFAAWLYDEDERGQTSLFDHVELAESAEAAAAWVLARARGLVSEGP